MFLITKIVIYKVFDTPRADTLISGVVLPLIGTWGEQLNLSGVVPLIGTWGG